MFNDLMREVIVCFVDTGGIVGPAQKYAMSFRDPRPILI
jgi:hypothetical protein